jgi:hypothetical protein
MDRDQELALVARLRAGDGDAFDEIHDAFNVRLFTFLARLSNRRDVAEDLLEETWLPPRQPLPISAAGGLADGGADRPVAIGVRKTHPIRSSGSERGAAAPGSRRGLAAGDLSRGHPLNAVEGMKPSQAAEVCGVSSERCGSG